MYLFGPHFVNPFVNTPRVYPRVRYAEVGGPNQAVSASASPTCVWSPTHATYPSGRISTAEGAATAPSAGSSHGTVVTWRRPAEPDLSTE